MTGLAVRALEPPQAGRLGQSPYFSGALSVKSVVDYLRDTGIECCGDECVSERVRPDGLRDPSALSDPADYSSGAVPVQTAAIHSYEDGPFASFADGQVNRPRGAGCQRDGDDLAALAGDDHGPVAAFNAQGLDVGAGRLRDPQPVEGQQGDQRVLGRRPKPGGDQ